MEATYIINLYVVCKLTLLRNTADNLMADCAVIQPIQNIIGSLWNYCQFCYATLVSI